MIDINLLSPSEFVCYTKAWKTLPLKLSQCPEIFRFPFGSYVLSVLTTQSQRTHQPLVARQKKCNLLARCWVQQTRRCFSGISLFHKNNAVIC